MMVDCFEKIWYNKNRKRKNEMKTWGIYYE